MPRVLPFPGLRYAAAAELERLVSPPYDVIGPEEQRALRALSPDNVSYVELPVDAPGPGQGRSRYRLAAQLLEQWRSAGVLKTDPRPSYYLAETRFTHTGQALTRRDLLAAVGLEPWSAGAVLPHEHTMAGPKADRLELLRATHLNSSPIWLLHRQPLAALDAAWAAVETRPPDMDFSWRDEQHRVWVVDDPTLLAAIQSEFDRGSPLYIADGHHRYETGLAFQTEGQANVPGAGATLAAVTWAGDAGMLVLPTHRLLSALDPSLTLEQAVERWSEALRIESYPVPDNAPAEGVDALMQQLATSGYTAPSFGLYGLGDLGRFAILSLPDRQPIAGALPSERSDAWKSLDVSLLHSLLVDPLVAQTSRPREDVLSYTRDPYAAFAAVRQGHASVALFLNPTPIAGVLAVADAHDRMPEKSTYFSPKPPAGLVLRDLDSAS